MVLPSQGTALGAANHLIKQAPTKFVELTPATVLPVKQLDFPDRTKLIAKQKDDAERERQRLLEVDCQKQGGYLLDLVCQVPVSFTTSYSQVAYTGSQGPWSAGNTYDYGNCTWWVKQRKPNVPNLLGNAANWGYALGYSPVPAVGTIAWTTRGYYGHVGIVVGVGDQGVLIEEMNAVGWNQVDTMWYPVSSFQYIYLV